jgi:hypothetical protein
VHRPVTRIAAVNQLAPFNRGFMTLASHLPRQRQEILSYKIMMPAFSSSMSASPFSVFGHLQVAQFSFRSRAMKAKKLAARGKYKLKTKKAFQKRFKVVSQSPVLLTACVGRHPPRESIQVLPSRSPPLDEEQNTQNQVVPQDAQVPADEHRRPAQGQETAPLLPPQKVLEMLI